MRFLFLLFFLPLLSFAQVYQGTIGKYPIVLERVHDEWIGFQLRYYYTRVKEDIRLYRQEKDTMCFCTEKEKNTTQECFKLKKSGKKLVGTWTKGDKKFNVDLAPMDRAKIHSNYSTDDLKKMKKEYLYGYSKLKNIQFEKQREEQWEGTVLEWYDEVFTKASYFRIKSSDKIKGIAKLNKLLEENHLRVVVDIVSCDQFAPNGGGYDYQCKLSYLSDQLISISNGAGYYCGGAHPDFGDWGDTYDLMSLQKINLSDLYLFDTEATSLKEIWVEHIKKLYPDKMNEGEDCDYTDPEAWVEYGWVLTNEGLHLGTYFPRVMRSCDVSSDWPRVPYSELEKYRTNSEIYELK